MARVLIAGCGYVGTELGLRLVDRGHAVWAVRQRASLLPPELHPHSADLTDPDAVAKLPFPFDFVVFAAAPAAGTEEAYEQAYIHALSRVLEAASNRRPPKRVLLTSSTSVYAQSDGGWVDESSPTHPSSFRGTIVLQAEEILRHSGSSFSILRLGGIYGPERTSLLDRVLAGEAVLTPGSSRYTNRIHRDDAASALLHLLELDPCAEVYVGGGRRAGRARRSPAVGRRSYRIAPPGRQLPRSRVAAEPGFPRSQQTLLQRTTSRQRFPIPVSQLSTGILRPPRPAFPKSVYIARAHSVRWPGAPTQAYWAICRGARGRLANAVSGQKGPRYVREVWKTLV